MRTLTTAGAEIDHINLALADLAAGEALDLAGEGREMMPHLDPAHAWVQEKA